MPGDQQTDRTDVSRSASATASSAEASDVPLPHHVSRPPWDDTTSDVIRQGRSRIIRAVTSDRYPRYRLLTGPDDDAFCYRVSEALELGYKLHGGPAITTKDEAPYVAQALLWTRDEPPPVRPTA